MVLADDARAASRFMVRGPAGRVHTEKDQSGRRTEEAGEVERMNAPLRSPRPLMLRAEVSQTGSEWYRKEEEDYAALAPYTSRLQSVPTGVARGE